MRKLLLPLLSILLFTSCQKQIAKEQITPEKITNDAAQGKSAMIDVCHKNGNGTWQTININANALPAHLAHGDIVPDADGDGYKKTTPCGIGDDCNDNIAAIHPEATEICENNIDDNCNGQVDENCIPSIIICDQVWMQKNLDVSKYRNGEDIPEVTDPTEWAALTTGAWCWYGNNSDNGTTYGRLYNWYAVNDPRGLAPLGWHVPTRAEWITLCDCLGGIYVAGGAMKETGITHWRSPNTDATNSSFFTGLPGGGRNYIGGFSWVRIGEDGVWWTSTEYPPIFSDFAIHCGLSFNSGTLAGGGLGTHADKKKAGFSIRCVRD